MLNPKRVDMEKIVSSSMCLEDTRAGRLSSAYRCLGGVLNADDLASAMRRSFDQPVSVLARSIVERRLVFFPVGTNFNVPCFQFEMDGWKVIPGVKLALSELLDVFDDTALAEWFVQPNCWIQYRVPCLLARVDANAVRDAARTARYIARGW
jgi:hypothetical protein